MSKNEYGLETINGYVVIANEGYWEQYKKYFDNCVKAGWGIQKHYINNHEPDCPQVYPCIVETEFDYGGDYSPECWQHTFTYKQELLDQLDAFNTVERELGIVNKNYCTVCGKQIEYCECDLW